MSEYLENLLRWRAQNVSAAFAILARHDFGGAKIRKVAHALGGSAHRMDLGAVRALLQQHGHSAASDELAWALAVMSEEYWLGNAALDSRVRKRADGVAARAEAAL